MLIINDLQVNYGDKIVLENLHFKCPTGEIHGILGMNGAGKTTFFNALYNFIPKIGCCLWNKKTLSQKDIAYLETANFFYAYMTGKEYLQLCALNAPNFNPDEWNKIFELPLNNLIDTYSTGMKKKLAILGMLALNRPILILDEPFNGVDYESTEVIYEILHRLRKKGKTILISSHIIESLTNVCDKISYLNQGKIERIYLKSDFSKLESELRKLIKNKVTDMLDELF